MNNYHVSVGNRGCVASYASEDEAWAVFAHYIHLATGEHTTVYLYRENTLVQSAHV